MRDQQTSAVVVYVLHAVVGVRHPSSISLLDSRRLCTRWGSLCPVDWSSVVEYSVKKLLIENGA